MNRRRAILAALLLPASTASADNLVLSPPTGVGGAFPDGDAIRNGLARTPPRNNECPVCGTVAKPYSRKAEMDEMNNGDTCFVGPASQLIAGLAVISDECHKATLYDTSASNLVRCKHCNAAFYQDGEA